MSIKLIRENKANEIPHDRLGQLSLLTEYLQKNVAAPLMHELTKIMDEHGMFKTCCNCLDYDHANEICAKFKVRPPCRVMVVGCEYHNDDIPF